MFKETFYETLKELAALPGGPGREHKVVGRLVELLQPIGEVEVDHMGNVYAVLQGNRPGPTVMVSAHSDEIACMVSAIDDHGFLRIERMGGILDSLLIGRKVNVGSLFGVIGVKAGHLQTAADKSKVVPIEQLYVDVGASSREEVVNMGISIGDSVTYISELERFTNQNLICGKAIDNRSCCALLVELFKNLQDKEFSGTLIGVVTVQEEIGLRGAQVAGYKLNPDYALVLDTIACTDTPDGNHYPIAIGKGPVLPLLSSFSGGGATGNVMSVQMKELILSYANHLNINCQLSVTGKGTTDLSSIHLVKEGVRAAAITFPRRYSHSPVEMADLTDFENGFRLLEEMIRTSDSWGELKFI